MEIYIIKTNGSWDTLKKISDIIEIQIIDSLEFEVAIVFNKETIEFKEWVLDDIEKIQGVLSINSKKNIDKYSKIFHIRHYNGSIETLCGINGRLGCKIDFHDAICNNSKNLCQRCMDTFKTIDQEKAMEQMCHNILFDEEGAEE